VKRLLFLMGILMGFLFAELFRRSQQEEIDVLKSRVKELEKAEEKLAEYTDFFKRGEEIRQRRYDQLSTEDKIDFTIRMAETKAELGIIDDEEEE